MQVNRRAFNGRTGKVWKTLSVVATLSPTASRGQSRWLKSLGAVRRRPVGGGFPRLNQGTRRSRARTRAWSARDPRSKVGKRPPCAGAALPPPDWRRRLVATRQHPTASLRQHPRTIAFTCARTHPSALHQRQDAPSQSGNGDNSIAACSHRVSIIFCFIITFSTGTDDADIAMRQITQGLAPASLPVHFSSARTNRNDICATYPPYGLRAARSCDCIQVTHRTVPPSPSVHCRALGEDVTTIH